MDNRLGRVLIVDIDPDTLISLQHVFEQANFDSTITWDEAEACTLLENTDFELIVIGDHPPELNAAAVLNHLRSRAACSAALILSGITGDNDTEYVRQLGAAGVAPRRNPVAVVEQVRKILATTQVEEDSAEAHSFQRAA